MTEQEHAILQALIELDAAVKAMPTANPKPSLMPLFARLDELAGDLPKDTAPELMHYLGKKSYEKARLWLEGHHDQIAKGGCRGD
jgi:hypothetical protein